jgi:multisubunit Na+/H+ antiporter MnhC subunit
MNKQKLEAAKKLFFILLGVDILITAIALSGYIWQIGALEDIRKGITRADPSLISTVESWDSFSKIMILTLIGVGFGLVRWLDASYKYAKEVLNASDLKNEKLIVFAWIIPIINLFKPYQIINEIYKVGSSSFEQADGWKKESSSGLLLIWWIFYAITHLIGSLLSKQLLKDSFRVDVSLQQSINAIELSSVFCVVSLIIAGLWFLVAGNLTRRLIDRKTVSFASPATKAVQNYSINAPVSMPLQASAPAMNSNPFAPPSKPSQRNPADFVASAAVTSAASDDLWAHALAEYDSGSRNQGLWARLFSESQGNETLVKANYLRIRVDEMQHVISIEKERVESAQKIAAAKEAELREAMNAEQRAYDALPKGICPSCKSGILPVTTTTCPKCWASLGPESRYKAIISPISQSEQINALRLMALGGNKLTEYEADLLKRGQ